MADPAVHGMLELASHLAIQAAAITAARFGTTEIEHKPDGSIVTDADYAVQAHLIRAIREAYPDHGICAEEVVVPQSVPPLHRLNVPPATAAVPRYVWVIDPLDGTRNFASGLSCFATSIGVLDQGWPVVGVVYEHNLRHLYTASRGGGALLNDRPLYIDRAAREERGLDLLTGVPSSKDTLTVQVVRGWAAAQGMVLRNFGSTALHLAMVASGALDATFCKQCKIWDIAAGALLVTEAGGVITDPFGEPRLPLSTLEDPESDVPTLAAGPELHARLVDSIRALTS